MVALQRYLRTLILRIPNPIRRINIKNWTYIPRAAIKIFPIASSLIKIEFLGTICKILITPAAEDNYSWAKTETIHDWPTYSRDIFQNVNGHHETDLAGSLASLIGSFRNEPAEL